jgi:hypothetical protein
VSIKFTPSSTARCRTRLACPRSLGLPQAESPHRRIAPKPNRLTVKSPRSIVPASAAPLWEDCFTSILSEPQRTRSAFSQKVRLDPLRTSPETGDLRRLSEAGENSPERYGHIRHRFWMGIGLGLTPRRALRQDCHKVDTPAACALRGW